MEETQFYLSEEELNDQRMLNRLEQANEELGGLPVDEEEEDEMLVQRREQVQLILDKLQHEMEKNKFGDLEAQARKDREQALALSMTAEDREFVEMVDQEYYKRVKTSDEYYRRKKLILKSLERLQKKVERQARNYDDYARLKFIMLEKATQKRSVLKNFMKLESFQTPTDRFWEGSGHGQG